MSVTTKHISVCVCTYRRPHLLCSLLQQLGKQDTGGLFTYSIVISDNDESRSAEPVVEQFRASSSIPISYCVEPRQNIALARNKAAANAIGELVAFIDDDEIPTSTWLLTLFQALTEYNVDGVLGPVKPTFEEGTPNWVVEGRFYARPSYPTGTIIDWRKGRTGNTLLKRQILKPGEQMFRPEFLVGEDQDFFRRMIKKGHVFIWCDEAVAYEKVSPARWKRSFMLRRALLRGKMSLVHPQAGMRDIFKSLAAVPLYAVALPFALLLGQARFMDIAVRLCDHAGRLLAAIGLNPIDEPYVIG